MSRRADTIRCLVGTSNNNPFAKPAVGAASRSGSSSSLMKKAKPVSDSIQKEYITNLQQQIYFLELELRLLKENGGAVQEQASAKLGMNAPVRRYSGGRGNQMEFSGDEVFEDHMEGLRAKYTQREKAFEEESQKLRETVEAAEAGRERAEQELARERGHVATIEGDMAKREQEIEQEKERHLRQVLELERRLHRVEGKLDQKTKELAEWTERSKEERQQRSIEDQETHDRLKEALEQSKQANGRIEEVMEREKAAQVLLLELQDNLNGKQGLEDALTEELHEAKDEIAKMSLQLKKMEIEKMGFESLRQRTQDEVNRTLDANLRLKGDVQRWKERAEQEIASAQQMKQSGDRWSNELVTLRHKVTELERMQGLHESECDEKVQQIRLIREQWAHAKESASDAEFGREQAMAQLELTEQKIERVDATMVELESDNRLQRDKNESLLQDIEALTVKLAEAVNDSEVSRAKLSRLQKRLKVLQAAEALKGTDFQGLMDTNLQMAKSIESLVNHMDNSSDKIYSELDKK